MNQCETVLRHLQDHGSITALEAVNEYGIMRLASRICDLRKAGFKITDKMVSAKNRNGETVSFKEYRL